MMRAARRIRSGQSVVLWRGCRGFTLVEMILALGIFALLAGAVFSSVQAVTSASAVLAEEQVRARRVDAFMGWCRRGFRSLPARAEVVLRTRETGGAGLAVDLLVRRAPGAFALGEFDARGPDIVLSALPDGRGGASLAVARFPGNWAVEEVADKLGKEDWVPLLQGVRRLSWTFWDPGQRVFVEQWPVGQRTPELIRLQMSLETGEELDAVFRTPRLEFRGDFSGDGEVPEDSEGSPQDPNAPKLPQNSQRNPNVRVNVP